MRNVCVALVLIALASTTFAQDKKADEPKEKVEVKDNISTTQHTLRIGGETFAYTAKAGTIILRNDDGEPRASFFVVSYTKDGADPATRPVTFTFNGGPGSSSVWLHMGAFGPKRVAYADDEGRAAAPPYKLVDNEATLLDATDLVFIDPVTTGFSRAVPFADAKKFHGFQADVESVGQLIRLWTTRNNRWASAKYLAGESYGTTRAAGLSGWLHDQGFYLNGIILISSILNFGTARFDTGNDLAYVLFLPTYTATAWYHKRLPPELQQRSLEDVTAEARRFALGDYSRALMLGDLVSDSDRAAVVKRLAELTGLSARYVEQTNLRIHIQGFIKELLRDTRRTAGRLDSRFTGIDLNAATEEPEFDPSYAAIYGEYTAVLNDWVRRNLKFETDLPYEILTGKVRPWTWDPADNQYLDVGETLRGAMARNPHMRVMVANGYYDLATPFLATEYTFNRMQMDPELRKNVSMTYYPAGHMMYIQRASHRKLHDDIAAFLGVRRQ